MDMSKQEIRDFRRTMLRLLIMMTFIIGYFVGVVTTLLGLPAIWVAPILALALGLMQLAHFRSRKSD